MVYLTRKLNGLIVEFVCLILKHELFLKRHCLLPLDDDWRFGTVLIGGIVAEQHVAQNVRRRHEARHNDAPLSLILKIDQINRVWYVIDHQLLMSVRVQIKIALRYGANAFVAWRGRSIGRMLMGLTQYAEFGRDVCV